MEQPVIYANWISYFEKNMYLTGMNLYASRMHQCIMRESLPDFIEHYELLIARLCQNVTPRMALKSLNTNFLILKLYEADMPQAIEYVLKRHNSDYKNSIKNENKAQKFAQLISFIIQSSKRAGVKTLAYYLEGHTLSAKILDNDYDTILSGKINVSDWDAVDYLTEAKWAPRINLMQKDMTNYFLLLIDEHKPGVYEKIFSHMDIYALHRAIYNAKHSFLKPEKIETLNLALQPFLERRVLEQQIKSLDANKSENNSRASFKI